MNEENNEVLEAEREEFEAIMPDGYGDGDDFFEVDTWKGSSGTAESDPESSEENAEEFRTIETESADEAQEGNSEEAPTTEQTDENAPRKLRFNAQIDHNLIDVELNESELPTMYQKAQALDRAQARLNTLKPIQEKAERLSKMLGFESVDEMFKSAEDNYKNGEVERLVNDGVHEEVAKDMVDRRLRDSTKQAEEPKEEAKPNAQGRDFNSEVAQLLTARPELRGMKSLPDEVVNDAVRNGVPLVQAYNKYAMSKAKAETDALKKENKTLRQNAEAARRAPVSGVSRGGATDSKPNDDPFLAGFDYSPY